jgi:hypothetical protein
VGQGAGLPDVLPWDLVGHGIVPDSVGMAGEDVAIETCGVVVRR